MLPRLMGRIPESLKQPPQAGDCAIKIGDPKLNVVQLPIRHRFSLNHMADVSVRRLGDAATAFHAEAPSAGLPQRWRRLVAARSYALGMRFTAAITHESDWFVARCLEVEMTSQWDSIDGALENLKEALELYFEDQASQSPLRTR